MMDRAVRHLCPRCLRQKQDPLRKCAYCGYDPEQPAEFADALPPFTVLAGKYLLGLPLGRGGFGIVYIARNLSLGNILAVKELYPAGMVFRGEDGALRSSAGPDSLAWQEAAGSVKEHFIREARILARLQEKERNGIVRVFDLFEENNTAYMVMEYLDGQSLKSYIALHGPQSYEWTVRVAAPVIRSLAVIHQMGIIHRDISPDNMMLLKDGSVKLLDFGGSKDLEDDGRSRFIQVKKGYTPLEQYGCSQQTGPWSDVYALCATMYYCLTGKTLPEPMNFPEGGLKAEDLGLEGIPRHAAQTLLKGLCPDARGRIQSMEALSEGLMISHRAEHAGRARKYLPAAGTLLAGLLILVFLFSGHQADAACYIIRCASEPELVIGTFAHAGYDGADVYAGTDRLSRSQRLFLRRQKDGTSRILIASTGKEVTANRSHEQEGTVTVSMGQVSGSGESAAWTLTQEDDGTWTILSDRGEYLTSQGQDKALLLEKEASQGQRWILEKQAGMPGQKERLWQIGEEVSVQDGIYELACYENTDRRLSVENNMGVDGSNICMMNASGENDQKFILASSADGYTLQAVSSGLYVAVDASDGNVIQTAPGGADGAGAGNAGVLPENPGESEAADVRGRDIYWKIIYQGGDLYSIGQAQSPQMVLTAGESSAGPEEGGWSNVWAAGSAALPEQIWYFIQTAPSDTSPAPITEGSTVFVEEGSYVIRTSDGEKVLTAAGASDEMSRGLMLWKDMSLETQVFVLTRNQDETYSISLGETGAMLGCAQIEGVSCPAAGPLATPVSWHLVCAGNKLYALEDGEGRYLCADGGQEAGTYVRMEEGTGNASSGKWILEKVDH